MTEDRVKAIRERLEKATPGPWWHQGGPGLHMDGTSEGYGITSENLPGKAVQRSVAYVGRREGRRDAEFIAAAPDDIAYLLERVTALEKVAELAKLTTDPFKAPEVRAGYRKQLWAALEEIK